MKETLKEHAQRIRAEVAYEEAPTCSCCNEIGRGKQIGDTFYCFKCLEEREYRQKFNEDPIKVC